MLLMCANRCGGALFRALFAEVDLDSGGEYQQASSPAQLKLQSRR